MRGTLIGAAACGTVTFVIAFLCGFVEAGGPYAVAARFRRNGGWCGLAERLFYALRRPLFASYFLIVCWMAYNFSVIHLAIGFMLLSLDTLFCALLYIGARQAVRERARVDMGAGNRYGTSGYSLDAQERAVATLRAALSEEQRADYDSYEWFEVTGSEGNRYRIECRASYNIRRCGTHRTYCVTPREAMPMADRMLAQKFWLETDEPGTIAVANIDG